MSNNLIIQTHTVVFGIILSYLTRFFTKSWGIIIIFPRNASFREYYVFVSNAGAASQFRCQRNTFEGFKLHSSNLTHVLLIQISRTSSIIDIVVPSKMVAYRSEMRSKVIFGHPKSPPAAILLKNKINFVLI